MILAIVMTDRASLHSMISSPKMCRLLCSLKLWRKTNLCFLKVFLNWAIWNSYLKPSRKDSRKIEPPSTLASNSPIEWSCQMWNLGRENPLFFSKFWTQSLLHLLKNGCICYILWKFPSLDVWCSALNLSNLIGGKICSEKLLAETYFRGGGDTLQPTNSIPGVKTKMRRSSKYGGGESGWEVFSIIYQEKTLLVL